MAEGSSTPPTLQKFRTYRDDFFRAQESTTAADATAMTTPAVHPSTGTDRAALPDPIPNQEPAPKPVEKKKPVQKPKPAPVAPPLPPPEPMPAQRPLATTPASRQATPQRPTTTKTTTPPPSNTTGEALSAAADLATITEKKKRSSLLASTSEDSFDVAAADAGGGEASIVTDTRRKRFRLIPAIIASISNWFSDKREAYEAEQEPKHTIAPATSRREVIEAAAKGGSFAPKDDHQNVARRLRHVPRTTTSSAVTIKEAADVPEPSWTHTGTEPVPSTADSDEAKPSNTEKTVVPAVESAPKPEVAPEPAPEPLPPPAPVEPPPQVVEQTPKAAPAPAPEKQAPVEAPEPAEPTAPAEPPLRYTPGPVPRDTAYAPAPTARPAFTASNRGRYVLIGVSILAALAGLALVLFLWNTFGNRDASTPIQAPITAPFTADIHLAVPLGNAHDALMQNLQRARTESSAPIVHFYPVRGDATPASVAETMLIFAPQAPGSFMRTVEDIAFGTIDDTPFIVLSVSSFDVAFAGMLTWETAMSSDLAPLFGSPVTATFDPDARTVDQTRPPFFTDVVQQNRDLRILYNADRNERIIYTFLNRNTILITTSSETISDIAALMK